MVPLLLGALALAQPAPLVGGTPTGEGAWSAAVGLLDVDDQFRCTGTLIHPEVVLTAGHCALGQVTQVLVGSDDWLDPSKGRRIGVLFQEQHPDFPGSIGGGDIGVIVLASAVEDIEPATLAAECFVDQHLFDGAPAVLLGFGVTSIDGLEYDGRLRSGEVRIAQASCSDPELGCDPETRTDGTMLIDDPDVHTCNGDSGGPLFLTTDEGDRLLGVTSRASAADPDPPCGGGSVHTRVDRYLGWIQQTASVSLDLPTCNLAPEAGLLVSRLESRAGREASASIVAIDPEGGATFTYAIAEPPERGDAWVSPAGVVTYRPFEGAEPGPDGFVVEVKDAGIDTWPITGKPQSTLIDVPARVSGGGVACSHVQATGVGLLPGFLLFFLRRRDNLSQSRVRISTP